MMDRSRAIFVKSVMDEALINITAHQFFIYRETMPLIRETLSTHLISPIITHVEEFLWSGDIPENISNFEVLQYLHSTAYRMQI